MPQFSATDAAAMRHRRGSWGQRRISPRLCSEPDVRDAVPVSPFSPTRHIVTLGACERAASRRALAHAINAGTLRRCHGHRLLDLGEERASSQLESDLVRPTEVGETSLLLPEREIAPADAGEADGLEHG